MSNRTERREAERAARKLAYKQLRQQPAQASQSVEPPTAELDTAFPISDARLAANRANAQLSSGPVSPAGKARSSQNAIKHGLTGKAVLLPHEDADAYQSALHSLVHAYAPANDDELNLVQSMHDCTWRIGRVQRLEAAILFKGHLEFASKYEDRTATERSHLIDAEAYLKYERQLRNLNIQEARLYRVREKASAELKQLQTIRRRQELAESIAPTPNRPAPIPPDGFVFEQDFTAERARIEDTLQLHQSAG